MATTENKLTSNNNESAIGTPIINKDFTKKVTTTFNKEQPIYIYCKSGGRSTKASMKLIGEKFKTIYNLTGGYDGFKK